MLEIEKSPWMNEELEILRDSVRKFYEREFLPHDERWRKQGFVDRDAWRKAGAAGLLCAANATEYGGGGGHFGHEAVIYGEQVRLGMTSFGNSVHSGIVAHYLEAYGSPEQKQRWLPRMASGDLVGAIAMTEPGTGSDLQGVKTTAKLDGNEYVVNGQKTFITNGQTANLVIVVAKTDPARGAKGTSLIVVETDEVEGFRRGRNLEKVGQKGQDTSELFFDDVRVPTANLLGAETGLGFVQLMNQLPQERLVIAVIGINGMNAAVATTIDYVKERKAFGQRLLDFQNTRFKLAEQKTISTVAQVFIDRCIELHIAGKLDAGTAAMAKWWATQMQCDVVDECLQMHGGYGYMLEYPIARMYADARIQKIYGGTNEIMKELIARTL